MITAPHIPEQPAEQRALVEEGFWPKFRRLMGRLPFAEDLLSAYYAAMDPATPARVRMTLYAALAYFVVPADLVPDVIVGLGYTDAAVVLRPLWPDTSAPATANGPAGRWSPTPRRRRIAAPDSPADHFITRP